MENKLKVIDLFAGVGGMSLGFQNVGFDIKLAIEFDEKIAYSYAENHHKTEVIVEDVSKISINEIFQKVGEIDIIIGGPPCQGFSQKGKRLSLNDERNFMFQSFIDFVKTFQPKYFLLENVPNIITTSKGFFKDEILKSFQELGYSIDYKVLNAANYGVPQNRKRAFFLGKKGTEIIKLPREKTEDVSIKDAIYDLPFIESGQGETFFAYSKKPKSNYQRNMRKSSKGIFNHIATKHSPLALERLAMIPKGKGREVLPKEHRTKSIYSGTWTRLKENGKAATITTRFDTPSSGLFTHPILNRCLTVREAARIQSFPDTFIFHGSKTSQMKQVGNAVPPLLAQAIAEIIYNDTQKL
jgi:DNA (cytosine-5)-methyltransferase 1